MENFELEELLKELNRIIESDCKASVKVRRLKRCIDETEKFAIEDGFLPRKRVPKK